MHICKFLLMSMYASRVGLEHTTIQNNDNAILFSSDSATSTVTNNLEINDKLQLLINRSTTCQMCQIFADSAQLW
jgi:hypothetical protein